MFQSNNLLPFQEEVVKLKSSQALDTSLERSRVKEEVKIYFPTTYLSSCLNILGMVNYKPEDFVRII